MQQVSNTRATGTYGGKKIDYTTTLMLPGAADNTSVCTVRVDVLDTSTFDQYAFLAQNAGASKRFLGVCAVSDVVEYPKDAPANEAGKPQFYRLPYFQGVAGSPVDANEIMEIVEQRLEELVRMWDALGMAAAMEV